MGRHVNRRIAEPAWWHGAALYQIYVRSWRDSDGDGYGDLRGVISGLDYLAWLGVDGIWLSPTMPSPDHDWGYDVSDYLAVHPQLGTLDDLDLLVAAGRAVWARRVRARRSPARPARAGAAPLPPGRSRTAGPGRRSAAG